MKTTKNNTYNRFKKFICLILIAFSSTVMYSQEGSWELYKEIDGISIYNKTVYCVSTEFDYNSDQLLLKLVNDNAEAKTISWKNELWYNDKCVNCDSESDEFNHQLTIPSNSEVAGVCNGRHNHLRYFIKYNDERNPQKQLPRFTKLDMVNIQISD